ncbi:MAG: hypothetical protein ABH824_02195 [Nanoarchaeota archaeon]|nr:hypothetical protein [Nanoarchaeota archaeon]MBU1632188.1 hypothetical protein [Nanoarchaeota archaeon]MBU1875591.1 hypothetical protein [Nanoarchaeota archaeon]
MIDFNIIIGIIGMSLILIAFVLDEFYKEFNSNSIKYNMINIAGSGFLMFYAYTIKGWPFFILNSVWFITAIIKIIKLIKN